MSIPKATNIHRLLLILVLLIISQQVSNAQLEKGKDFSYNIDFGAIIKPINDSLFCYYGYNSSKGSENLFQITVVDSSYKEVATREFLIDKKLRLTKICISDGTIRFVAHGKKKAEFYVWDYFNDRLNKRSWTLENKVKILKAYSSNESLVIVSSIKNDVVVVEVASLGQQELIFHRDSLENQVLFGIDYHDKLDKYSLVTKEFNSGDAILRIKIMSNEFRKISQSELSYKQGKYRLNEYKLRLLSENNFFIYGKYAGPESLSSSGVFIGENRQGTWKYFKLLDFDKFENFHKANVGCHEFGQVVRNRNKAKTKGREYETEVDYLLHDVLVTDKGVFLSGEVYFKRYEQVARTRTINGQTVTEWVREFQGYVYSHLFIVGIDEEGKKTMDDTYNIDFLSPRLNQRISFIYDESSYFIIDYQKGIRKLIPFDYKSIHFEKVKNIIFEEEKLEIKKIPYKTALWHDFVFIEFSDVKEKSKGKLLSNTISKISTIKIK